MHTGTILINQQKTFDRINHTILLDKLLPITFPKNTISLYESFSSEIHFTVEVINRIPDLANILCSVPQGSMLGPVMFLIYVNDMSQAAESNLYLYLDDSCFLLQDKEVTKVIIIIINSEPKTLAISVIGL